MVHGPKEKKERSLGERLQLKGARCLSPKCAAVRKPYRPGAHGKGGRVKALSDFGKQIKEKQKFKLVYGLNENNLKRVFGEAAHKQGSTAARLMQLLELRLDNVVFRMGFASSRGMSRQLVRHGHMLVNKKKVTAPGYVVKVGDVIGIRPESVAKNTFRTLKEDLMKYQAPAWLQIDPGKLEGRVLSSPESNAVPFEVNLLVESYSK